MGRHGPPPKRPDKRHGHRGRVDQQVSRVAGAAAEQPPLDLDVTGVAVDWYEALAEGAEARYYTPAMWQRARIVAHMLHGVLTSGRPSSTMYAALQADMKALLVDAGELRRLGIFVEPRETEVLVDNVIDWRALVDKKGSSEGPSRRVGTPPSAD